jgi:Ca2+-transporting ATPase
MEQRSVFWHSQTPEQTLHILETDPESGLDPDQAEQRLARYGPNELVEQPRPGFWQMLLVQFNNFVVIILIVAAIISFLIGLRDYSESGEIVEFVEATAIVAIVILNAAIGVVQENKAEEALAALKKMATPDAHVLRGGHRLVIPSRLVVPGDIVFLEAGNYVPADVRLLETMNLKIDEASLTGESVPVDKRADLVLNHDASLGDRRNTAYLGTLVTYGRGRAVVTATGMQTQIGHIADLIQTYEEEPTPLQIRLNQLGKLLGWAALTICGLVFVVGLLRDVPFIEMFLIAVSLAIAAVPEGLPAIVTINLALGMREMIRRHALIRRLPAVETLGSASTICSDKTGTLTQNEMMVTQLAFGETTLQISGDGYRPEGQFHLNGDAVQIVRCPQAMSLLRAAMLCSDAQLEVDGNDSEELDYRMVGDPTEGALVVAAAKAGLWRTEEESRYPRVAEVPFDSKRKRMTTVHQVTNGVPEMDADLTRSPFKSEYVALVKGAPDVLLDLSTHVLDGGGVQALDPHRREAILQRNKMMAAQALRVLGFAFQPLDRIAEDATADELERDLIFIGLAGMIDPARPEVVPALDVARRAGIRTLMITGDYPDTAQAIAQEIGLLRSTGALVTGAELDQMDDATLRKRIDEIDVFARVSPEHKVRIVEALKDREQVVAMTGDGVNDAPALKRANIGVAMGITGTDVSKETADMVLTDDNYVSIVSAVEQGRIIYSNIRKFVYYLLSCNLAEIMIIFIASLLNWWPTPLTAIQLLWLNLLTDGAPALALGLEKGDPDIMERAPRPAKEPIVNREMRFGMVVQTVVITGVVLIAYQIGLAWGGATLAQTLAFVTLSSSELLRAYTSRSERYSLFAVGVFSNKYMQYAVAASLALLLLVVYVPLLQPIFNTTSLGIRDWAAILPLIVLPSVAAELTKWVIRRATSPAARAATV